VSPWRIPRTLGARLSNPHALLGDLSLLHTFFVPPLQAPAAGSLTPPAPWLADIIYICAPLGGFMNRLPI